jgi:hypothetical protein
MDMTLLIAVQLVGGQADYLVNVDTLILGILLAPAYCILHTAHCTPHTAQKPDNVQHVNGMVLKVRCVTVKEMSVKLGKQVCAKYRNSWD